MKRSEAIKKLDEYQASTGEDNYNGSEEILDFIENELGMLPPVVYPGWISPAPNEPKYTRWEPEG